MLRLPPERNSVGEPFKYQPIVFAEARETDPHRLQQRQRQLDLGKNTIGYAAYIKAVPKESRERNNPAHPMTPDTGRKVSKRAFDGYVRAWRRALHQWDEVAKSEGQEELQMPGAEPAETGRIDGHF